MRHAALLVLPVLLLAGCTSQPPSSSLRPDAACPPLPLHSGQTFSLRLPATPSAGYRWELRRHAAPQLEQVGEPRFIPPEQAGLVGTTGVLLWTFRARQPGSSQLLLDYRRPWDQGVAASRQLQCDIEVRD